MPKPRLFYHLPLLKLALTQNRQGCFAINSIMENHQFIRILKQEMQPALGVTEPSAIALASAKAYQAIGGRIKKIDITTDPGIFKNGYSCGIPGTDEMGNEIAAILGVLAGDPELGLRVLEHLRPEDLAQAVKLRKSNIATVQVKKGLSDIFIDARVSTDQGDSRVVIEGGHTNIVSVEVNGIARLPVVQATLGKKKNDASCLLEHQLADFIHFADRVSSEEIAFTLEALKVNRALAETGKNGTGMRTGPALTELLADRLLGDDIITHAQTMTAYAVDARMGGKPKPAMSICGSGNHGIIATMPLLAVAEKKGIENDRLARAIALSYLVTIYIKAHSGKLSAFCGCAVAAGAGVSAGTVYLLKGTDRQIGFAVNNMAADITGVICDGGNFGCSLKAITAVGSAIMSALLALKNVTIPPGSGIVGRTAEETMKNMGKIASPGMIETDETIVDIMTGRSI